MRRLFLSLFILAVFLPAMCFAGPPSAGVYNSIDIGGSMLSGRFSESYMGGGPGQVNNTIHAQSFDTVNLGTQWRVECPSIASISMISDTRDGSGTGDVVYQTMYGGGTFWLAKNGPWGDNTVDYVGTLSSFVNTSTHQYIGGSLVAVRSNVTMVGTFDDFSGVMEFAISNSATFGDTGGGPKPATFPEFRDQTCTSGPTQGAWGSVPTITMTIQDAVPAEIETFGTLKARF
jgi:hypothetical protein